MDYTPEGQLAGRGCHRRAGLERAVAAHQAVGFLLQDRAGRARDDAGDAAAVGEAPVGRVDDGLHRFLQQVAAYDVEDAARCRLLAMKLLRRGRYSIFALARRLFTSSSSRACTSCCCRRGRTSARAGNFTGRTSSSWMTWKPKRVRTGVSEYLPFSSLTIASENALSKAPGTFQSRSPPRCAVPPSFEFLVASSSNLPPFFSSEIIPFAWSSVSTRM